jgi:hypothetical protein
MNDGTAPVQQGVENDEYGRLRLQNELLLQKSNMPNSKSRAAAEPSLEPELASLIAGQ